MTGAGQHAAAGAAQVTGQQVGAGQHDGAQQRFFFLKQSNSPQKWLFLGLQQYVWPQGCGQQLVTAGAQQLTGAGQHWAAGAAQP